MNYLPPPPRRWVFRTNYCTVVSVIARSLPSALERAYKLYPSIWPQYTYDFIKTYPITKQLLSSSSS